MTINGDGLYLVAGLALLLGAILPRMLRRYAVSAPIGFLGAGVLLGLAVDRTHLSPIVETGIVKHLAELTILVALMGVGLAIDRPIGWRRWMVTWRLLLVAMPACIAAVAGAGWLLGLAPATALLLGRSPRPDRSGARLGRPGAGAVDRRGRRAGGGRRGPLRAHLGGRV